MVSFFFILCEIIIWHHSPDKKCCAIFWGVGAAFPMVYRRHLVFGVSMDIFKTESLTHSKRKIIGIFYPYSQSTNLEENLKEGSA